MAKVNFTLLGTFLGGTAMTPLGVIFSSGFMVQRFSVAEVARLRSFGCFGQPEFWQIRLPKPHYFLAWGICTKSNELLWTLIGNGGYQK